MTKKVKQNTDGVLDVNLSEQAGEFDDIERCSKTDDIIDLDVLSKEYADITGFRADINTMLTEADDDDKKQRAYNKLMWLIGNRKGSYPDIVIKLRSVFLG